MDRPSAAETARPGAVRRPRPDGVAVTVRLVVRLTPRGGRDAAEGWARDGDGRPYLRIRVAAPPVDGAANGAVRRLVAKALRVGTGAVRIVSGDQSRVKHLEVDGVEPSDIDRAFGVPD